MKEIISLSEYVKKWAGKLANALGEMADCQEEDGDLWDLKDDFFPATLYSTLETNNKKYQVRVSFEVIKTQRKKR